MRCGHVRDIDHDLEKCTCRTCGAEIHDFVAVDDELHSCRRCPVKEKHQMEHFSEVRESPKWTSDIPYFVEDVSGQKCSKCRYEIIEYTGIPR